MVRLHQLYALILLLAVTASGQVVTSDSGALTARVWGATVNAPWYLRTIVVQGATPLDLTDRYVSFTVRQVDTEALVHSSTGTIHSVNPGEVIFVWTPSAPGTYSAEGKIRRIDNDEIVANIMADTITVANPASSGGGIQVVPTNINLALTIHNTTINTGIVGVAVTTNAAPAGVTTNGDGVAVINIPPSTGSGGGDAPPINGQRPTNWNFNASYPFTVTTTTNADGGTITYGLSGSAGTVVIPAGNTSTSFIYYVDTNEQYYTASPTATQLLFFGVTPAAGFSAGGIGMRYIACTGSQVFACYIPQGGLAVSNGTALGGWGYVKGGSATSTNATLAVSGAGSLAVLTGTNIVMHIGAPGGSSSSSGRANGGGLLGYSLGLTTSGGGGTQTNHGAAATAAAGATAGSSTNGGNGTATGGAYPGGGGGGGFYSGGGACGGGSLLVVSGGAGSTYVGDGYTSRAASDSASPPSTDHPLYKTPYGVGIGTGLTLTNSNRGNPGFLAVVSYPSP